MDETESFKDQYRLLKDSELEGLLATAWDLRKEAFVALIYVANERNVGSKELLNDLKILLSDSNITNLYEDKKYGFCKYCKEKKELFGIEYSWLYSIIFITKIHKETIIGCHECLSEHVKSSQTITVLAGWWGFPFGIFATPLTLIKNHFELKNRKRSEEIIKASIIENIKADIYGKYFSSSKE